MIDHSVFFVIGMLCGLIYAILGIVTIKFLRHPTYFDKYFGWSLWWVLDRAKYTEKGKKYCTTGAIFAFLGGASWVVYFLY